MEQPFTLGFIGWADPEDAAAASAYEDEVLPLLAEHGARVVYRGRRAREEDPSQPLEVHLLWFPGRAALEAYLADPRRQVLIARHGDPFSLKQTVELEMIEAGPWP